MAWDEAMWCAVCQASWDQDAWAAQIEHDPEAGPPPPPADQALLLRQGYERLLSGEPHFDLPVADAQLARQCGFSLETVDGEETIRCCAPANEYEPWLERHERGKNAAREQAHRQAAAARAAGWAAMLKAYPGDGNGLVRVEQLDAALSRLKGLVRSHFDSDKNLGLHAWCAGARRWLLEQKGKPKALVWQCDDTAVTELGGPELATALVRFCASFSSPVPGCRVPVCDQRGQVAEKERHEWRMDPGVSDDRLDELLDQLPSESKLQASSVCGQVQTSEVARTNVSGEADEKSFWSTWCTVL